jgi:hypothetical protein
MPETHNFLAGAEELKNYTALEYWLTRFTLIELLRVNVQIADRWSSS